MQSLADALQIKNKHEIIIFQNLIAISLGIPASYSQENFKNMTPGSTFLMNKATWTSQELDIS